jgi:hypothetical protein
VSFDGAASGLPAKSPCFEARKITLRETAFLIPEIHSLGSRLLMLRVCINHQKNPVLRSPKRTLREIARVIPETPSLGPCLGLPEYRFGSPQNQNLCLWLPGIFSTPAAKRLSLPNTTGTRPELSVNRSVA